MAKKDDILGRMQDLQAQIEQTVASMPPEAWTKSVYKDGWNARQLLAHMASTSGTAGFILGMARVASAPSLGASYGENAFNAQQVASREGKTNTDLFGEINANFERDIAAVQGAPADLHRSAGEHHARQRATLATLS